jgi:hypothetical protein
MANETIKQFASKAKVKGKGIVVLGGTVTATAGQGASATVIGKGMKVVPKPKTQDSKEL